MRKVLLNGMAVISVALLSGCAGAAFNRVDMKTVRNVSVGQELIDLQTAHERGIISDTEYAQAKQDALKLLNNGSEMDID